MKWGSQGPIFLSHVLTIAAPHFMAVNSILAKLLLLVCAFSLAACQSSNRMLSLASADAELLMCIDTAHEFRADVHASNANNAAVTPLKSVPFLATNRFYAALAGEARTTVQIDEWVQSAATLAATFRQFENKNLAQPWSENKMAQLNGCSQLFATSGRYAELRQEVVNSEIVVKDNYSATPQWLGLYPLLRPIFKSRIDKLHREEKRWFAEEENFASPLIYGLTNQSTEPPYGLEEWFIQSYQASALGIPKLSDSQLAMLFELHAPQLEIDYQAERDKLGTPTLSRGNPAIDTTAAIAYTLPSYTRFNGVNLLQLNYVVWFPERGPVSPVDLFAGKIDSLIWRVTLDTSGRVLLHDSVHSCGCYHKYFLADDSLTIREPALSSEPANLIRLINLDVRHGLRLVISSNEHYVVDIKPQTQMTNSAYSLAEYGNLYTLPFQSGSASLFGPSGIINGSERLERFTLWPTGIESVGAMRQWGTHATGFVERQHFDDANLFEKYLSQD
jgi:hypothetical protein